MFDKILIANRGEIACRIARTAKDMGIGTVAVYSDADREARHVRQCDEALRIGPAPAAESYLCGERIIDAALKSGAEAIHPGYGFLSENPRFAETCEQNNLVFIGPPADAIRVMGAKNLAKTRMVAAGVPVVAGYQGEDQSAKTLKDAAGETGYPLLIKAVAGGGGKGMRMVAAAAEFAGALAAVKRESAASFADDRVLLEKYLPVARHIEIQIFADEHGHTIHLFERDCSIQRRHQKVIEEAPAPGIGEQLRKKIGAAAVDAAKAIGYVGAGTVEFLLDPDQRFYFMEMNTRLQVEHPVTEMITGQDLVEWQLRVAAGLPLPCRQQDLRIDGHAMEARIYAENPDNDFLPATGTLAVYRHGRTHEQLRIDSGVGQGDDISPHYDPMIAKLIVRGHDRESARKRLRNALAEFDIVGVTTNLRFLHGLTGLDDFIAPVLDTALIERNSATLFADGRAPPEIFLAIATLFEVTLSESKSISGDGDPFSPWSPRSSWPTGPWQLNLPVDATCAFAIRSGELSEALPEDLKYTIRFEQGQPFGFIDGECLPMALVPLEPIEADGGNFQFQHGGRLQAVSVDKVADTIHVNVSGCRWALTVADNAGDKAGGNTNDAAADAGLTAPMPGTVVAVAVKKNQRVKQGAPLLTLEAMKMEHTISAPHDGRVTQLFYQKGDQVREGEQLLRLEAPGD